MEEHYKVLEKLIEMGKTDINLQYNTNFSEMSFKKKHVFDLWKHFSQVSVGASLDDSYDRGELIRGGTNWKQTVENRKQMIEHAPHVDFYVSSTVSVMNVHHVMEFHREWTELGLVKAKDWDINVLHGPDYYRVDILPEQHKEEILIPSIEKHLEWLRPQDSITRATIGYEGLINTIRAQHNSHLIPKFVKQINREDEHRKENFWTTVPELAWMVDYE